MFYEIIKKNAVVYCVEGFLFDQSQLKSYHTNLLKQEKLNDFSENRTAYQIIYCIY
jgi:hypothetical protein